MTRTVNGTGQDPEFIKTANGGTLLDDGWYAYYRKPHYTTDILQALCWGLICGSEVSFEEFRRVVAGAAVTPDPTLALGP